MKVSKHFTRSEFECRCGCGFATVDVMLIGLLESVREHFGRPVRINSGCRCPEYNDMINGTARSKHKEGMAADIVVDDIKPKDVQKFVLDLVGDEWAGVGCYQDFTHIDSRMTPARWGRV